MASIQQTPTGWRAQIKIAGVRESACFAEKFEAEAWAHQREVELAALKRAMASAKRRVTASKHRFLDTCGFYSHDEIVAASTAIPDSSGVYFLISNNTVVYVGKSINVHRRIQEHLKAKCFDRISVMACPENEMASLELHYIRQFRPILNIAGTAGVGEFEVASRLAEQGL